MNIMRNILVADDSAAMRQIIVRSLWAIGFADVLEARDGDEAVSVVEQGAGAVEIVLLDWNMPGKDCAETVKELLALDDTIRIILITTQADAQRVRVAFSDGVADYITKPFTAERLRETLERLNA